MNLTILETIKKEEGFSGTVYKCTEGFNTIGYGTRLPITAEEAELLVNYRLEVLKNGLHSRLQQLHIKEDAWDVLYLMAYQMGVGGVLKFKNMIKALEQQDYKKASIEMLDSRWAKQTPQRAKRMSDMMAIIT